MRLSKRRHALLFTAIIAFVMVFFMSGFMTFMNIGYPPGFYFHWMKNCLVGYLVAFPIAAVAVPFIRKQMDRYFQIDE